MKKPGRSIQFFINTHMGFFLFINSFYIFSIFFLKTSVSLNFLSHLPATLGFHLLIYKSEFKVIKVKYKVSFLILTLSHLSESLFRALCTSN